MEYTNLVKSVVVCSAVGLATYYWGKTGTQLPPKPKLDTLNKPKPVLKMAEFYFQGFLVTIAAEKKYFKKGKLINDLKSTIRNLKEKNMPITPFFVVYYSPYSGQQVSVIEMNKLDTISERKSWLDEEGSDGYLVEPTVEYPLKSDVLTVDTRS